MDGRHGQAQSDYRYGFNGMEADNEIKGEGNSYNYGERISDPRIARWFRTDNVIKAWISPYNFSANNPIIYIDPNGNDEIWFVLEEVVENGETKISVKAHIIEDGKTEVVFRVFGPNQTINDVEVLSQQELGDLFVITPFEGTTSLPNQGSYEAKYRKLPLGIGDQGVAVDDYTYLGTLLQFTPNVIQHFRTSEEANKQKWVGALIGAKKMKNSLVLASYVEYLEGLGGVVVITRKLLVKQGINATKKAILKSTLKSLSSFEHAGEYGFMAYSRLRKLTKGKGLHAHHLLEKRFAKTLGMSESKMTSIALTPTEHLIFTKAWDKLIGRDGTKSAITTSTATTADIFKAAKEIYKDYPEILKRLGL